MCTPVLQINEFHRAPTPFFFTSPLNSTVLPTLRVSGEGVLKEFGFQAHRFWGDVFAIAACSACTYSGSKESLLLSEHSNGRQGHPERGRLPGAPLVERCLRHPHLQCARPLLCEVLVER